MHRVVPLDPSLRRSRDVRPRREPPVRRTRGSALRTAPAAVDRGALATSVDHDLVEASRAEAVARRRLGSIASELLRRRGHRRLGFASVGDYARERLGMSARALEEAAAVAGRLDALPVIDAAFRGGELTWTVVRQLVRVASPQDESWWLSRARGRPVNEVEAMVDAARARRSRRDDRSEAAAGCPPPAGPGATLAERNRLLQSADDADGDLLDGEPAEEVRVACPGRVRSAWRHAVELARRVAGAQLPVWQAAEAIAAEGVAGRPMGMRVGDRIERAFSRVARGHEATACAREAMDEASVASTSAGGAAGDDGPHPTFDVGAQRAWIAPEPTAGDAFELDRRLRLAVQDLRSVEPRLGRLLRLLVDHTLYRALGYRALDGYVRNRLGISVRKVWALLAVQRAAWRAPAFGDAYGRGELSWVRALTLLPVVERANGAAWVARARAVTLRRLGDEVDWSLHRRDALGPAQPLDPPPLGLSNVQIGAHAVAAAEVPRNGIGRPYDEVAETEVRFFAPTTVAALFREALDLHRRAGEPGWRALERLLRAVTADWNALPRHRDPIFARDGWRCTVPACSARRQLHDHHLRFRSRGGGNERSNRVTVCAAHHLHGLHEGIVRAWGTAPDAVYWEVGVRREGPPLMRTLGDRHLGEGGR